MFNPNEFAPPGMVPRGVYTLFVHSVEQRMSKKGNPMDAFKLEIIAPLTAAIVNADGSVQTCNVAKTEINTFLVYQNDNWLAGRVEGLKRLGIKVNLTYDSFEAYVRHLQDQTRTLQNMCFDIQCGAEPEYAKRPLTAEDVARGVKEAEDIKGPDGKPLVLRWRATCDFAQVVGNLRKRTDGAPDWGPPPSSIVVPGISAPETASQPTGFPVLTM